MNQTISEGTLRTQDLLPAFLDALREIAPAHYEQLLMLPFGYIPAYAQEDEDSEWWASEEAGWKLAELVDLLDEHAPEGAYFGAHMTDTPEGFECACVWFMAERTARILADQWESEAEEDDAEVQTCA